MMKLQSKSELNPRKKTQQSLLQRVIGEKLLFKNILSREHGNLDWCVALELLYRFLGGGPKRREDWWSPFRIPIILIASLMISQLTLRFFHWKPADFNLSSGSECWRKTEVFMSNYGALERGCLQDYLVRGPDGTKILLYFFLSFLPLLKGFDIYFECLVRGPNEALRRTDPMIQLFFFAFEVQGAHIANPVWTKISVHDFLSGWKEIPEHGLKFSQILMVQ